MRITLSGGAYKFHLTPLASEISKRGQLLLFITAGWPYGIQKIIADLFPKSAGWKRFLDRKEDIPDKLVKSVYVSEFIFKIADIFVRNKSQKWQQILHIAGFRFYANIASKALRALPPEIYHYRNCYGGVSVRAAQKVGAVTLCDHSIAHPLCLDWMERNQGTWPVPEELSDIRKGLLPLYRQMEKDLTIADHIIVNSDFVKETCIFAGLKAESIHVVYLGVDKQFMNALSAAKYLSDKRSHGDLLFAGGWQKRKGVETLAQALLLIENQNWKLFVAGGIEPEIQLHSEMKDFLLHENVNYIGVLPRTELARLMKSHRIFVFPSYCEGSARVIFEAMAAGCFIITTKNAGSIVEDGVHGCIVQSGDAQSLAKAITQAIDSPEWVDKIRANNANLVMDRYQQSNYCDGVLAVYRSLTMIK